MPNEVETAPAPAGDGHAAASESSSSLAEQLTKGLKLADELTTPAQVEPAAAAAAAAAGETTTTTTTITEQQQEEEERNGISFLFEGDLQYALPPARKQLVDVGTSPNVFPHKCQWRECAAVEEAREEKKGAEEEGETRVVVVVTQTPRFPVCAKWCVFLID